MELHHPHHHSKVLSISTTSTVDDNNSSISPEETKNTNLLSSKSITSSISSTAGDTIENKTFATGYSYNKWSQEEDDKLKEGVDKFGENNWRSISELVTTRDNTQCRQRWFRTLKPGIQKGKWSTEEDNILRQAVHMHGTQWSIVRTHLPHRTSAQCRERWCFHLSPELNKTKFSDEEDYLIMQLHKKYGNKWSKIANDLNTNRSEASIRSRYQSLCRDQRMNIIKSMNNTGNSSSGSSSREHNINPTGHNVINHLNGLPMMDLKCLPPTMSPQHMMNMNMNMAMSGMPPSMQSMQMQYSSMYPPWIPMYPSYGLQNLQMPPFPSSSSPMSLPPSSSAAPGSGPLHQQQLRNNSNHL